MIFVKQMVGMPRVWFLLCVYTVHTTRLGAALNVPHIKRKTHTHDQTMEERIIGGVRGGGSYSLLCMQDRSGLCECCPYLS
jgi:hypothetical protein